MTLREIRVPVVLTIDAEDYADGARIAESMAPHLSLHPRVTAVQTPTPDEVATQAELDAEYGDPS